MIVRIARNRRRANCTNAELSLARLLRQTCLGSLPTGRALFIREISMWKWYYVETLEDLRRMFAISDPGVYVIVTTSGLLYIGQSIDIGKRLRGHVQYDKKNCVFSFTWVDVDWFDIAIGLEKKRFDRLTREARLISRLEHRANKRRKTQA